ncbi:SODCC.2: Superoxide dismutase [Cu-Zn] 2 [Gossypium australe]|uniref:SODCC.2: Superoxide dismutase [Cu-Zn] 2 n=1 Tax=Gossypium australe TaxID=47621 RepID=A0A5B6VWH1_9ROSI|nr:SODCC.2: Superoxide dismutase [Cu-Zn] 2 [Gossypium australe]
MYFSVIRLQTNLGWKDGDQKPICNLFDQIWKLCDIVYEGKEIGGCSFEHPHPFFIQPILDCTSTAQELRKAVCRVDKDGTQNCCPPRA